MPFSMDPEIVLPSNRGALRMLMRVIMFIGLGVMSLAFLPTYLSPVGTTFLGLSLYALRVISIGTCVRVQLRNVCIMCSCVFGRTCMR